MSSSPIADRRQHQRHPLAMHLEFYHPRSKRQFAGRSIDVSEGGLLMYVPATTPVQTGDTVEFQLPEIEADDLALPTDRPMEATVARVDRKALLTLGHIAVGVKFGA